MWLNLPWPICSDELMYLLAKARLLSVAWASPVMKKLALKVGSKKLDANCLLESVMKAFCDGFSNESYRLPVLYWENC